MIVSPILLLIAGFAFGFFCYFIGRLTMALEVRYAMKYQPKHVNRFTFKNNKKAVKK